ncbi:hypothetical protein HYH02_011069 [Chlamydomonas schloesseri]|uniref:SET domain-containing protein n=1 Tax=Chlamydomonas schloesseri TaxID=2026947 RepID=A0A835TH86_9CHLO|nr:hypothetical protein HYH02_011069 [Chlamydomonas schloesseri]|eukprot:KAG2437690.1 hypothetical protein HYH02_011069 [Chlamydomonas schloesseri]
MQLARGGVWPGRRPAGAAAGGVGRGVDHASDGSTAVLRTPGRFALALGAGGGGGGGGGATARAASGATASTSTRTSTRTSTSTSTSTSTRTSTSASAARSIIHPLPGGCGAGQRRCRSASSPRGLTRPAPLPGRVSAAAAGAAASAAGAAAEDLDPGELDELMYQLYCSSSGVDDGGDAGDVSGSSSCSSCSCSQLPAYCGPLELREVPGAGVGVYATEHVTAGQLLLATHPLALLRSGPGGGQPSPLDLAALLSAGALSPLAATWLTCLAADGSSSSSSSSSGGGGGSGGSGDGGSGGGGSGGGGSGGTGRRRRLAALRSLFKQPFDAAAAAAPSAESTGGGGGGGVACPLPPEAVLGVVAFNAYGEQRPDPVLVAMRAAVAAAAAVRQQDEEQEQEEQGEAATGGGGGGGCVGLWPAFSLINHSCAPVASYGLVGDVMVVRAAADLSPGQQVTISYSGRRALAPLAARRAYLLRHYGFLCACERCSLEDAGAAAAGADQEAGQQQGADNGSSGSSSSSSSSSSSGRLPVELPDYLEGLHATCGRMVAPHLAALLSPPGRSSSRWRDSHQPQPQAQAQPQPQPGSAGGGQPWAADGVAGGAAGPAGGSGSGSGSGSGNGSGSLLGGPQGEDVGDVVAELQQLAGYLSQCWQQVLRAAAAATTAGSSSGADADGSSRSSSRDDAGGGGGSSSEGLSEREVLWLEGSVFLLLNQLMTAVAAAGLLQRIATEPQLQLQLQLQPPAAWGPAVAPPSAAGVVDVTTAAAAAGGQSDAGGARAAAAKGRRRKQKGAGGSSSGGGGQVTTSPPPPPPLPASIAVRALAARRWRLSELPPPVLQTYVDLLSQAADVAGAVAPGSDLSTALAVRLLAGVEAAVAAAAAAAAAGAAGQEQQEEARESEAYREAELRCYDTLSAKYGILDFDTYEQLLAACCRVYGAEFVRLPGVDPVDCSGVPGAGAMGGGGQARSVGHGEAAGAVGAAGGGTSRGPGGVGEAEGAGGGMAGLPMQAVEVEAEVVVD